MLRHPPDILDHDAGVAVPDAHLAGARDARGVEAVIVDEIHAVAHSKRGSHLALTLERLEALVAAGRADRHEAPASSSGSG